MLLTTEQVKNFAHGYLHLTEQDGWLCFYCYTPVQEQYCLPQDPDLLFDDFHPSDKGFATIVQNLKPRLEKIFNL